MTTRISPLALALAAGLAWTSPALAAGGGDEARLVESFDLADLPGSAEPSYGPTPVLALADESVPRPTPAVEPVAAVPAPATAVEEDPARIAASVREAEHGARTRVTWENVRQYELVFQALNVIDLVQTATCLSARRCSEGNPILGRNPSLGALVGLKLGTGLLHFAATRWLLADHPGVVKPFLYGSIAIQGGVVAWNMQHVF